MTTKTTTDCAERAGKALLLCLMLSISGCAFVDQTLQVTYDQKHAPRGPIEELQGQMLQVNEFRDIRTDQERIGYVRNGFDQKTADVRLAEPVTTVVQRAVVASLEANGMAIGEDGSVIIDGDVTQFWSHVDAGYFIITFRGTISCHLAFREPTSQHPFYEQDYIGHYEKRTGGGTQQTKAAVMTFALENLVENVVRDRELVKHLKTVSSR